MGQICEVYSSTAGNVCLSPSRGEGRCVIIIDSSVYEQKAMEETTVYDDWSSIWKGHSFSTREVPTSHILLNIDDDEVRTSDHTVVIQNLGSSLKSKFDVSPLEDLTIPSYSLDLLNQPNEEADQVTPLAVVHPHSGKMLRDIKQEITTPIRREVKVEPKDMKLEMVNDAPLICTGSW